MTQPRDNTGKEELVEEVKAIADKWAWASISYPDDIETDDIPHIEVKTGIDERGILPIITLISQAIERGDILLTKVPPELPGEEGRLEQEPQTRPYARGVEQSLRGWILNRFKEGARTFIALSPAERKEERGKEEE